MSEAASTIQPPVIPPPAIVPQSKGQARPAVVDRIAEASAKAIKESVERYAMPKASVGMSVLWYVYGETDKPGMPAIVSEVGLRTLSLTILLPEKHSVMYKDGVRHVSDQEHKREEYITTGCWDYSEQTKEIMQLRADLERLRVAIE